jgi:glycosyltransferase involved in cell wall biosynthesis
VFFHETWIPYDERQNYFLDADIGISTHFDSLETRLSFRTRILDYLWTGLPIITTAGDYLSDLVRQHQVGITISPSNVTQMKDAILRLSDDVEFVKQCRENIRQIRPQFAWSEAIKPLEQFCSHPYRTSHLSRPALWAYLGQFYANTAKDLFKYRGYSKILTKIRQKLFSGKYQ